jgi:hypothetical protein
MDRQAALAVDRPAVGGIGVAVAQSQIIQRQRTCRAQVEEAERRCSGIPCDGGTVAVNRDVGRDTWQSVATEVRVVHGSEVVCTFSELDDVGVAVGVGGVDSGYQPGDISCRNSKGWLLRRRCRSTN